MPIYAYRCTDCGFEKDVMRKVSDPLLTTCPECKTGKMVQRFSRRGPFFGCSRYPECRYAVSSLAKIPGTTPPAPAAP